MRNALLGDRIAIVVEDGYNQLSAVCKPVTRSNGLEEWTVLAGLVAINRHSKSENIRLLSVATGVKALPDVALSRSHGKMVHDCHAEVLALRGFNTLLLEHMNYLKRTNGNETELILKCPSTALYTLKHEWELALYISTLPCGDASMNTLQAEGLTRENGKQEIFVSDSDSIQYIDEKNRTIIRGRFNYDKHGVVRTKPGRHDSEITLSKSCSDKLCMKQVTSVLNCMTWDLMSEPVYIKYLVVPLKYTTQMNDLRQSLHNRVRNLQHFPFQFLNCSRPFQNDKPLFNAEPSLMSSIKLFICLPDSDFIEEAILNGVKNGFYSKGTKPLRKNCEPIISKYSQWKLYNNLKPEFPETTYLEFKASNQDRNKLIETVRLELSPDGWISTQSDNFR